VGAGLDARRNLGGVNFEEAGGKRARQCERARPSGLLAQLTEAVEDTMRAGKLPIQAISGTMGVVDSAALTNEFLYDQDVQAFYFTYQRPFGPLTAQIGLRAEAVQIDVNQVTSGITDENSYTGLYPTLHLAYELSDSQQLTASYSRRIQRPGAQDLNPYVIFVDPFNLRAGNPDLDPQITDSFEAAWQFRANGAIAADLAVVLERQLSVRQTEKRVASMGSADKLVRQRRRDPFTRDAEEKLSRRLQSRVRIVRRRRGGKVEIAFGSEEELIGLYERLARA